MTDLLPLIVLLVASGVYFSFKSNRECFLAMMVVGLPIALCMFLLDWLSGWTLI